MEKNEDKKFDEKKGPKPDYRICQSVYNQDTGESSLIDVGAMWKNVSKSGKEFYSLKIGNLKLLVFNNEFKD